MPRAVHRACSVDPDLPGDTLLATAGHVLDAIALAPLDRPILLAAGALAEPMLRSLDAIHIATAIDVGPIEAFITYDARQSAGARLAGLRSISPGT